MIRKYINYCSLIPRGYGVAWKDPSSARVVCYPIPLNIIAGVAMRSWWWLRQGGSANSLTEQIADLSEILDHYRKRYNELTQERDLAVQQRDSAFGIIREVAAKQGLDVELPS